MLRPKTIANSNIGRGGFDAPKWFEAKQAAEVSLLDYEYQRPVAGQYAQYVEQYGLSAAGRTT